MDVLGIGPLELLFILIIVIVVVGPRDISKTARALGRGLNTLYKSEGWKAFNEVSRQLRGLPNRLAREAELEEIQRAARDIKETIAAADPALAAWTPDGKDAAAAPGLSASGARREAAPRTGSASPGEATLPPAPTLSASGAAGPTAEPDPSTTAATSL